MVITKKVKLDEINSFVAIVLAPLLKKNSILTLQGQLGAGKTTLVKALLNYYKVEGPITSPTFTYVNHYSTNRDFYHFDLYRLESQDEFTSLGFDEYLYDESTMILIEWPEVINSLLDEEELKKRLCKLGIKYIPNDLTKRLVTIETFN